MATTVLTALGHDWEGRMVEVVGQLPGVTVGRRCVDLADLLAAGVSGRNNSVTRLRAMSLCGNNSDCNDSAKNAPCGGFNICHVRDIAVSCTYVSRVFVANIGPASAQSIPVLPPVNRTSSTSSATDGSNATRA